MFLYYKKSDEKYNCVVAKHLNGDEFIITTYMTDRIKINVWFDDPRKEETAEEIVLVKDKNGRVIEFEVLNYLSQNDLKDLKNLPVETEILA